MIDPPAIMQTQARVTAVIRFRIPRAEIRQVMGPGHTELMAVVNAQGIGSGEPWFSRHFRMDPEIFDFEIGVPVTAPVQATGRVLAGELPAAQVARTIYRGGYEGLGEGWGEFMRWIEAEGLKVRDDLWEYYVAGPGESADPAQWRTELNRPLAA
ncbi:MAG: GyrI-like domain-containing protein [Nevskia sp.]